MLDLATSPCGLRRLAAAAAFVSIAMIATSGRLEAQEARVRAAVAALDDSLASVGEAEGMDRFLTDSANEPRGRDPLRHLRRGLVRLRASELGTDRRSLDDAIRSFDEATLHARDWPWPWLGLARAKLALAERGAIVKPSMHQELGEHYEDAALTDLARALELDSAFTPAAHFMANLMAESPGDYPETLHRAVRAAAAVPAHGPGMQLLLGRLERHLAHDSLALTAFRTYEVLGGDPGVAALETARTRAQMGELEEAEITYLDGIERAGDAGRAAYRADLAYVATVEELGQFDSIVAGSGVRRAADASSGAAADDATSLSDWVDAFWRRRDAAALRRPGERLSEHLRRWVHVMREFRVVNRYWNTEGARLAAGRDDISGISDYATLNELIIASTRTVSPIGGAVIGSRRVVNDLGFMYMRHGEPSSRVSCPGGSDIDEPPTTSWVYAMPEGTVVVHFSRGWFTPIPSLVPDMVEGVAMSTCLNRLAAADPRFGVLAMEREGASAMRIMYALMDRMALQRGELPARRRIPDRSVNKIVSLAVRDRESAERALVTDTYPQHFEEDLQPVLQLYAVGTPASGSSGVLAVFAVRADRLEPGSAADGRTTYPLRVRLAAIDPAGNVLRTIDTLRTFAVSGPLPTDAWLSGIVELPIAPGTYDVRLLVTQPGTERGAAGGRLGLELPGDASDLTMSDIVTGREGAGLTWQTRQQVIPLNPLGSFGRSQNAELYYEIGGMRPGTAYTTTIEISRGDEDRDRTSLTFTETADRPVARVQRSIGLGALRGGRYVLTVSVEEQGTGRMVTRERWLDVVGD